ncbi:MAG: hypothetical protein ABI520_16115, partial [Caldimonas sp.]
MADDSGPALWNAIRARSVWHLSEGGRKLAATRFVDRRLRDWRLPEASLIVLLGKAGCERPFVATPARKGAMADEDFPDALPARYRLHWYVLERVLGQGGFGITYLAHDTNLDRRVAIKEYLPTEVARRRPDASARPRTETHAERYAWGLERFLSEARTLARFDHPNIVRVLSVFEANNTAYMVMRFEEGEDL